MTGMAMSAARIVEDGVIKVGAELGRAVLMLVPFADSGIGECNLVNAGSTKGSLGKLHIVDNEMEVERMFWLWLCAKRTPLSQDFFTCRPQRQTLLRLSLSSGEISCDPPPSIRTARLNHSFSALPHLCTHH